MIHPLLVIVTGAYLLIVVMLFLYGVNFFYLSYVTWRRRHQCLEATLSSKQPRVTIQLPIYNELYVAERLIRAAAQIDYPPHLLEIQVLDDSTDETVEIARDIVEELRTRGVNIHHIHRTERKGYKAGALAAGMEQAHGEFLAIFDADFIPPSDFLQRTLSCFRDPNVAFVQTRWEHTNRDYSLLTFLQSLAIDAHFMVEQFARSQAGFCFNFNGTAGIWRRAAIQDAGGWKADTLTEDLDLSYRTFLRGWHACYLRQVSVPAELPANFNAFRRQQHRWARGSLECAYKLLPQIWKRSLPLKIKLEATLHLTGYGIHLLLFIVGLLYPLVLWLFQQSPSLPTFFGLGFLLGVPAFAPTLFFILAQQQLRRRWWRTLPLILFLSSFGMGMMLNTVRAALQALLDRRRVFERTPKFGLITRAQKGPRPHLPWRHQVPRELVEELRPESLEGRRQHYQLRLDRIVFFELTFALLNLGTAVYAIRLANLGIALYATLFCVGLLFTSGMTLGQSLLARN